MSYNSIDKQPLPVLADDSQAFEDKSGEINLDKVLFIVKKRLIYLLFMLILGITGAFLYLRYTKPIYEATAQIKLDYKTSSKIINIDLPFGSDGNADYLAGEIQIIKSNPIYQAVLDSVELRISYFAEGDIIDSEIYQASPFRVVLITPDKKNFSDRKINLHFLGNNQFKIPFQSDAKEVYTFEEVVELNNLNLRFKIVPVKPEITGKYYFTINSDATLLNYIARNLSVTVYNPQSNTINISFTDNNPSKAVDIIRALIKAYYVKSIEKKNRAFEQALTYLDAQIEVTKDSLDSFERQLQTLLKRGKAKPLQEEISMKFGKISDLETKKIELKISYDNYEKLEKLVPQDTSFIYLSALATLTGNSSLQEYIKAMIASKNEYDRIQSYYKATTFSRQQRLEEVKNQKARLLELIRFHKNLIAERIKETDENLEKYRANVYTGGDEENTEAKKIAKNYSIYEKLSSLMLEKYVEINIAKSSTVADFQIISHPYASKTPIFPRPAIAYGIGLGVGLAICVWYIVLVYVLDNKINSIKDIDRRINLPILGLLPYIKDERVADSSKLIVDINPKAAISEAFRSIRTNLDFIGVNQKKKIISVTSTVSGEGKTFIAVNLAGIIALSDVKVVVIDLDMRKPKIHRAFDTDNRLGVSSLLIGRASLDEIINDTHIPSLKFITAGTIPPNPSELLLSERFAKMLDTLQEQFEIIILDTPPVGLVTDAILIMKRVTMPLYIMRAGYSRIDFVDNIKKLVAINKFSNISIILNAVDPSSGYGYGSGYYKYGYLYGGNYSYSENDTENQPWYTQIVSRFKNNA